MTSNAQLASATIAHLVALGVRNVVVCAGARNAPLVTTLLATREDSWFKIFHHFDERTASFFALGLSKKEGHPSAVITTSGTAVAELLPATVEACYSGLPLVLVTADRPVRYRGSGAPQAIEQPDIFGNYAESSVDVEKPEHLSAILEWQKKAPLHLNVCFEEPGPDDAAGVIPSIKIPDVDEESNLDAVRAAMENFVADTSPLVAIVGALPQSWKSPVETFLHQLGAPVWLESTSGLRESEKLAPIRCRFEKGMSGFGNVHVLRIGGVPSLRFWRDLEEMSDSQVMSVSHLPFSGLARSSQLITTGRFPFFSQLFNYYRVIETVDPFRGLFHALLDRFPGSEPALVRRLAKQIPSDALVFLGNSLPIREWNLAAPDEVPHPRCHASRGANGIDGQLATFLGMSEGEPESWGIFGDLTALYDLNAPAILDQLCHGKRRIVVINNGGGRIFSRLSSLSGLSESHKEVTENRHGRRMEDWAKMWNMEYESWRGEADFLLSDSDGVVLEVIPDNDATEAFWSGWK